MKLMLISFFIFCSSFSYAWETLKSIPVNSIKNGTLKDGDYEFRNTSNGKRIKVSLEDIETNQDQGQSSLDIMIRKNGTSYGCKIQTLPEQNNILGCKVKSFNKKISLTVLLHDLSNDENDKHYLLDVKFFARGGKFHPTIRDNYTARIIAE